MVALSAWGAFVFSRALVLCRGSTGCGGEAEEQMLLRGNCSRRAPRGGLASAWDARS